MILRRIAVGIKNQDWFVVGLEIMIVVIGIFIGLQVDDWNEDRHDRVLERNYYQQILFDLKVDQNNAAHTSNVAIYNEGYARLLYDAITTPDYVIKNPDKLIESTARVGYTYLPSITVRTINELTSTGRLHLLTNLDLKRAIVDYYAINTRARQWDSGIKEMQVRYRNISAGLITPDHMRALRNGDELNITSEEAQNVLEKVRARKGLKDFLTVMAGIQTRLIIHGKAQLKASQDLSALIKKHLEETS